MKTIKNKVALVTGASSGIGKETVKDLLKEGVIVYAAARRVDKMQDLAEMGAKVVEMDVTVEESIIKAIEIITKQDGGVDILVNNAGYGSYGAIEDVPMEEARRQFDVNIFGLARLTQWALPYMRNHQYGKIVNISSMGGKVYTPLGGWYHATKYALEGFSDCLRLETREFGIDVIIVEPGGINTEWGGIASDSAIKMSGHTAYKDWARALKKVMDNTEQKGRGSHPSVISQTIVKAVKSNRPRARYAAGYMARPVLFFRWLLSDRMFDGFIKTFFKK